jgi:hypothetical protein
MSQVRALISGLLQEPGAIKCLIEDPQGFARLAGLGERELKALSEVGNAVSGVWNRLTRQQGNTAEVPGVPVRISSSRGAKGSQLGGGPAVAIAGVVSLLAVAGAVVAVGTVSLVALSGRDEEHTA